MPGTDDAAARRRAVVIAGHRGDAELAARSLDDPDPTVRAAALGALDRCGRLSADRLTTALDDPDARVRRRAIDLVATRPGDTSPSLMATLADDDHHLVEHAAWASGERRPPEPGVVEVLAELARNHDQRLVREAAVAAIGAIGDPVGLPAVLAAMSDVATVRRRAALALAPFDGSEVEAALTEALGDRDWQVRQAAADVLGVDDLDP